MSKYDYDYQNCTWCTKKEENKKHPNGGETTYCNGYKQWIYENPFCEIYRQSRNSCQYYQSDLAGY